MSNISEPRPGVGARSEVRLARRRDDTVCERVSPLLIFYRTKLNPVVFMHGHLRVQLFRRFNGHSHHDEQAGASPTESLTAGSGL